MLTALLPMKGHSERVPDKNIRLLAEKPLFFYIVRSLLASGVVSRLIINTDSQRISDMATNEFGDDIEISWRPPEIQGDYISMNKIIAYELERIADPKAFFIQTHSTNPFLRARTIAEAFRFFLKESKSGRIDSLFSVTEIRSRLYRSDLSPINHNPSELIRTQDLKPVYEENSNFYFFTAESFLATGARIGKKPGVFAINSDESIDIDTPKDWTLASYIAKGIIE